MFYRYPLKTAGALLPIAFALSLSAGAVRAERTTSYTYTDQGQLATEDGPRTDVEDITTYDYDAQGNRALVRNALGHETRVSEFDGAGRPLQVIDANGLTTELHYDPRGRLLTQSVSDGSDTRTTAYAYDPAGNLTQVDAPDGTVLKYTYDAANRLIGLEDGEGNRLDYTLDAMGHRLESRISDATGTLRYRHRQVFNRLGRLIQTLDARDQVTAYAYDANGNLIETTDPRQNPTRQAYDALERLQQSTDALDGVTQYTYDAQDHLTGVTDPNGLTTTYDYDGLGNLLSQNSPDTGTTTYTYDEAGNRLSQTDARGVTVTYEYDALNRLTAVHYPDSALDVSYTYDQGPNGVGRLTGMSDAGGTTEYRYNGFGQWIERTHTAVDGLVSVLGQGYDSAGRPASLSYPSGQTLLYDYDAQGRLRGLELSGPDGARQPLVQNIRYLPFGPLHSFDYGNGLHLERGFDPDYRLTEQNIPGVLHSGYEYDPAGNLTRWQDLLNTGREQLFGYDELDRLIRASGAYGELGYDYDATGNRLIFTEGSDTRSYRYVPGSHRLQEILGTTTDSRDYDAAGNTIESLIGSYRYDASNRMVGFSKAGIEAEYLYNGRGERIQKNVNGTITRYRYAEDGQLLGEYDAQGEAIREYVYLEGRPVAQLQGGASRSEVIVLQSVSVNHLPQEVALGKPPGRPVVIAGVPTIHGSQGAVAALSEIGREGATVRIREWNALDGGHALEELSLLTLPPGRYPQADGSLWEIGRFRLSGSGEWKGLKFREPFAGPPYLFLSQQTQNGTDTTVVRARQVDANGFEAALYEEEGLRDGHEEEEIGYVAVYSPGETGLAEFYGRSLEYRVGQIDLDEVWTTAFDQSVQYQEEQSLDSELDHLLEKADILWLEGHLFAQDVSSWGGDTAAIRRQGATPAERVVGETAGGRVLYLHGDHLGAVVKATDSAQTVVWAGERRPFGRRTVESSGIEMPLGYAGQYYDEETGNYYNYFRDYDPTTGRYLQSDPIGLKGGLNTYSYVGGNPIRFADPYGLVPNPAEATCIDPFQPICWGGVAADVITTLLGGGALAGTMMMSGDTDQSQSDASSEDCPPNKPCPPCKTTSGRIVPVGTIGYRPLDIIPDDEMQHGVYGSHHNIFVANQNPNNCQCFWQKQKYVLKPDQLTPNMIPVEPFVN